MRVQILEIVMRNQAKDLLYPDHPPHILRMDTLFPQKKTNGVLEILTQMNRTLFFLFVTPELHSRHFPSV